MRLINADDFKVFLQNLIDAGAEYSGVIELLDKQATAFDVDKVVERLENLKDKVYREDESLRASNRFIKADDAIEIVRNGGSELSREEILTYLTDEDVCDTDEFGRIIIKCNSCRDAGELLRNIIAVIKQNKNRWTPLKIQLPDESDFFLVTYILSQDKERVHRSHELYWDLRTEQWYFNEDLREIVEGEVIAWQLLPKPYII